MLLDTDDMFQFAGTFGRDLAAVSATSTRALGTAHRPFRVEAVELISDAAYAADPTNYYTLTLQVGATVIATWSTLTGQQGALTANVPAAMVLSATDANLIAAAGGVISLVLTKVAAAANITLRVNVRGRFVA